MREPQKTPSGLEDAARQFELLYRSCPYGAVYHDASTRILATNPAAQALLGLGAEELRARDVYDPRWNTIHEDGSPYPPEIHPSAECLRSSAPVRDKIMGIWNEAEGRYRWALLDAFPQFEGGSAKATQVIVWVSDITERVEARREAARSADLFRSLFSNMSEGVALHEIVYAEDGRYLDYRIVDINPSYPGHVGISREAAVGKLGTEVYGVSPAPYLDVFCGAAARGESTHFETYFPPLDKHFIISVAPLGRKGFATIFFDISENKRGEAERERLLTELERKNRELESLVYVASHDLRSPLVNIQGFGIRLEKDCAELARLALAAESSSELKLIAEVRIPRSLEFIRTSGNKMDKLIAGLLYLSRTGRAELASANLDMDALLRGIVASMAFQVEGAGASIEYGSLPPCRGDAQQIGQVFSNLLDNALKYRDSERKLSIRASGERRGGFVEYRIEDTGRGIAPEHLERVWELFQRLEPNDGMGGEGLGLTLVRRIVDRHGGRAWAASELGRGSSFFVRLPAAKEASDV